MAISKILHMKDCGSSFHGKHLKSALEYITVSEKTQNGRLVSAINCQVDNAFEQMKETKKKFNKTELQKQLGLEISCTSKLVHYGVYTTTISEMESFYGSSSIQAYIP